MTTGPVQFFTEPTVLGRAEREKKDSEPEKLGPEGQEKIGEQMRRPETFQRKFHQDLQIQPNLNEKPPRVPGTEGWSVIQMQCHSALSRFAEFYIRKNDANIMTDDQRRGLNHQKDAETAAEREFDAALRKGWSGSPDSDS
ncbi:hypothetical protein Bbelb_419440 [Branchiostoma belcheri]|nr:hypothetical protein Bbelb_419440 [Branchiostoma belcheri]